MTHLVLLTGLPATGKSTVAVKLAKDYGFVVLSTDELRQSLFREDYGELRKKGKEREEIVRKVLDSSKIQVLSGGFDLVIDASAPTNKFRKRMLELPKDLEQAVEKSLLHLRADESILYSRQKARGRTGEAINTIKGYWDEPKDKFLGSALYEIDNNTFSLDHLYNKVDQFYKSLRKI